MSAEENRRKAADFLRRAKSAADPLYKAWLLEQAQSLIDLADQAKPNEASSDDTDRPAHQQQQQQNKKDE